MSDEQRAAAKLERDMQHVTHAELVLHVEKGLVPNMRVPGRVYVGEGLRGQLLEELRHFHASGNTSFLPALYQIGNAASLPGAVGASIGLPDIHTGYGFAIGHVVAFDMDDPEAVVSPGGVGFDINCGVRMLRTNLTLDQVRPVQQALTDAIFERVPVGVGGRNREPISLAELRQVLQEGMRWAVARGFAWPEDAEFCEERGCISIGALPSLQLVNQRAEARGLPQLGTLGSGNHYAEVQAVTDIYDAEAARAMGIHQPGQICIMIHCGSRGLGHQYADDAIKVMDKAMRRDGITLNDPMLACTRITSPEGQTYLGQMAAASNFAYVNRSIIAHRIREAFSHVFGRSPRDLDMATVYDVAHNIAKVERHVVEGAPRTLLVHRKGATRAFPPGHPDLPAAYQHIGQPVLVGGSMGTCSYVLTGTEQGMRETMGTTCHGAGRAHSRHQMKKLLSPQEVKDDLRAKGITFRVGSDGSLAEEAPSSYKDVTQVVEICKRPRSDAAAALIIRMSGALGHRAGISKKAFRLEPVCVVKG